MKHMLLILCLMLTLGGCAPAASKTAFAPALLMADTALEEGSEINMLPGERLVLSLDLPEGCSVELSADTGAIEAAAEGGELIITAVSPGSAALSVTFTASKQEPVTYTVSVLVAPREQSIGLALAQADGLAGYTEDMSAALSDDGEGGYSLSLIEGKFAALKLFGAEDTEYEIMDSQSGFAVLMLDGDILTVAGRAAGSDTITVTARAEGYESAYLQLDVSVSPAPVPIRPNPPVSVPPASAPAAENQQPAPSKPPAEPSGGGDSLSDFADEVFRLTNIERTSRGLSALSRVDELDNGAQIRAEELTRSFSHQRPGGGDFYTVFGVTTNYYFGENVAMGQRNPAEVVEDWMNSAGHRKNILASDYVGLGVGVYQHNGIYYWAQIFRNSTEMQG